MAWNATALVALAAPPPSIVGSLQLDIRHATGFAAQGDLGILIGRRGAKGEIIALQMRDPLRPEILGTLDVDARLNAVVLDGRTAYLATSATDSQLLAIDLSDPTHLAVIGSYDSGDARDARSLALRGTILFLGARGRPAELVALDVSDPRHPTRLDSVEIDGTINALALDGDALYAATSRDDKELIVFDVAVPTAIVESGFVDLPGSADAMGVDVDRQTIYVARKSRNASLSLIERHSLTLMSQMDVGDRVKAVRVYRDRIYLAVHGGRGGLDIVDISDATNPHVLHRLRSRGPASDLAIRPPFAYASMLNNQQALLVVDLESLLRPNIVVVYTDDQHESSVDFMPNVQALAERGVLFRESFVTTPLCGPSRASFLTGLYAHNHGALMNFDYIGARADGSDDSTVATWLQSAGYRTGFFGKYVNGFLHKCNQLGCKIPPGWDEWQAILEGHYFNYSLSNNGTPEFHGDQPQDYSTDVLAAKLLDFIARDDRRPFFAVLATNAPHSDETAIRATPAPRHLGALDGVAPWRPPSYDEEDLSDKLFQNLPRASDLIGGIISLGDLVDTVRQHQLEALLAVDEALGEIVGLLESLGEDRDTLVIFTSDNGFNWGEHRLWIGKSFPFEESIRVPLVVAYPRLIEAGRVNSNLVANIDLAPTIAELTNVSPFNAVDGSSLVPLLKNDSQAQWRSDFLIENYGSLTFVAPAVYEGIRSQGFMYAYWVGLGDEIYDLAVDPDELENRSCSAAFDDERLFLRERIDQLVTNPLLKIDFDQNPSCGTSPP